jgi:gamma-glutamylcyclotransferase (GGCT)/AIG2-like uncharacterized protein YtfP
MNANPVPSVMENGWGNTENKIIQIYPNPATTVINFTFQVKSTQQHILQIYSFIGKKMYETRVQDTKLTVQLDENYYRGIYVYQLRDIAGRLIESGKFQVIK